jgi:hypothetical protein
MLKSKSINPSILHFRYSRHYQFSGIEKTKGLKNNKLTQNMSGNLEGQCKINRAKKSGLMMITYNVLVVLSETQGQYLKSVYISLLLNINIEGKNALLAFILLCLTKQ